MEQENNKKTLGSERWETFRNPFIFSDKWREVETLVIEDKTLTLHWICDVSLGYSHDRSNEFA